MNEFNAKIERIWGPKMGLFRKINLHRKISWYLFGLRFICVQYLKKGLSLQYIICTTNQQIIENGVNIDKLSKSFFSTHFYISKKVPKNLFSEEYISFKNFPYLRRCEVILFKVSGVIYAPSYPN